MAVLRAWRKDLWGVDQDSGSQTLASELPREFVTTLITGPHPRVSDSLGQGQPKNLDF